MISKKQKTRTVILVIILAVAIVAGVFGISYYMGGYTAPWVAADAAAEEELSTQKEVTLDDQTQEETPAVEETTDKTADDAVVEDTADKTDTTDKTISTTTTDKTTDTTTTTETTALEPTGQDFGYRGALSVEDGRLVDADGDPVQLVGVSSHGLSWFPEFISEDSMVYMKEVFGINVVRLAMYTSDYNGYCVGGEEIQNQLKDKIDEAVTAAVDNDMYIIIDWHILNDGNPNEYKSQAIQFFGETVRKYAGYDNVIYEICNEPNGDNVTWEDVKEYATEVIPVIREVDKDAIILVGTPTWCQDIDEVAEDPLEYDNIMYTFHFYASEHKAKYRNRLIEALDEGLPVFISEFGLTEADGDGEIDEKEVANWLDVIEEYNLSCCIWNLSNKAETSALISPESDKTTDWSYDDLSVSGQFVYDYLTEETKENDN